MTAQATTTGQTAQAARYTPPTRTALWPGVVSVHFSVLGLPVPQGSKRVFNGRLVDANHASLRPYRALVAAEGSAALARRIATPGCSTGVTGAKELLSEGDLRPDPTREAVAVDLRFGLPRPKSHFGTGRNAGRLKPSAPAYPGTKPDVDKLSRAVLDALTGVLWADDSQVVILSAVKVYAPTPMTVVTVQAPPVGAPERRP